MEEDDDDNNDDDDMIDALKDGWTAINQSTIGLSAFWGGGGAVVGNDAIYLGTKWNRSPRS